MAMRRTLVLLLGIALLGMRATPMHAQEQVTLQSNGSTDLQPRAINTWVDQANPTTNNSTDTDLHIAPGDTLNPNVTRRAVLQFDLSRIPRAGIKLASLDIWVDTAPTPGARRWEVRQTTSFTGFASAGNITWNNRTSQLAWTLAGGDFSGTVIGAGQLTSNPNPLSWDLTTAVQTFFGVKGGPPDPNYGFIIKDQTEKTDNLGGGLAEQGQMASNSNATVAHRPSLVINFMQQVNSLTATPGAGTVTLNWVNPTAIGTTTGTGLNPYSGVIILRNANSPVSDNALIRDGTALPALCSNVNASPAIVVFESTTLQTTFTDSGACPTLNNGTTYFYKVLTIAQIGVSGTYNYSENGNASGGVGSGVDNTFAAEISATPNTTPAGQQAPLWVAPVHTATLSAPSIDPGNYAIIATNNDLVQGFSPTTGNDAIAPASVGGTVSSRMPVLESTESDWGMFNNGGVGLPMTFLASSDSLIYDVSLNSSGFVKQFSNPLAVSGAYTGGAAMQVKAFSNTGNTKPNDVILLGTHVAGTSPTVNTIFAAADCDLSVTSPTGAGCTGSFGGTTGGWNITGGSVTSLGCSSTSSPAVCNIDIVMSTPFVDYQRNTVWVTSRNGNTSGQVASPDVWKLNANDGTVLAAVNVGGDIDSSPTGTQDQSVIFVSTNASTVIAYDPVATDIGPPVTPHQLAISASLGDGAIKGFPLVATSSSPWTVIVSTTTKVTALSFNGTTFSSSWSTAVTGPSSPITGPNLKDALNNPVIIVGGSDGKLHELRISDGVDEAQRIVDLAGGVVVGDPSLDLVDNEVIVGASDGRVYAFAVPF